MGERGVHQRICTAHGVDPGQAPAPKGGAGYPPPPLQTPKWLYRTMGFVGARGAGDFVLGILHPSRSTSSCSISVHGPADIHCKPKLVCVVGFCCTEGLELRALLLDVYLVSPCICICAINVLHWGYSCASASCNQILPPFVQDYWLCQFQRIIFVLIFTPLHPPRVRPLKIRKNSKRLNIPESVCLYLRSPSLEVSNSCRFLAQTGEMHKPFSNVEFCTVWHRLIFLRDWEQ